ncbi:hypothetical protein LVJ82_17035 [Vitreoscilla massiliensis]|uniref:Uncharacterized protein n=1 Tax=Vitreoscilla massiliensis TaxID=1689272 RepID=A0ABY4E015_9NEIS|nr:hypothetical protein [Vitreoscilla massiliensis]UOO89124.1 hypothetical protein LVJ82_17035 [Vitreoscilla massiliensis]
MEAYITVTYVDSVLGSDWASVAVPKERAVMLANLWLSTQNLQSFVTVPDAVKMAGIELVQLAVDDQLYQDTSTGVVSKRVKADSVEVETEYSQTDKGSSQRLKIALDLIAPFVMKQSLVSLIWKI